MDVVEDMALADVGVFFYHLQRNKLVGDARYDDMSLHLHAVSETHRWKYDADRAQYGIGMQILKTINNDSPDFLLAQGENIMKMARQMQMHGLGFNFALASLKMAEDGNTLAYFDVPLPMTFALGAAMHRRMILGSAVTEENSNPSSLTSVIFGKGDYRKIPELRGAVFSESELEKSRLACPGCGGFHAEGVDWAVKVKGDPYDIRNVVYYDEFCSAHTGSKVEPVSVLPDFRLQG
jgi:hypothetical protein